MTQHEMLILESHRLNFKEIDTTMTDTDERNGQV